MAIIDKAHALEKAIHNFIPLSRTLEFHIQHLSPLDSESISIKTTAPLEPNVNIHSTAFAGSIYSVGVLTAWAFTTHLMNESQLAADVVIGKAEIVYKKPITSSIACSVDVSQIEVDEFLEALRENQVSRIKLKVNIGANSEASLNCMMVTKLKM